MARVVAYVFDKVENAEGAIRKMLDAGIPDDDIGVVAPDDRTGGVLADDLGRDYRAGDRTPSDVMTSRSDVFQTVPAGFVRTMHDEGMPDDADNWYRQHLHSGHVMVITDTKDHMDDAMRIMREHGGMTYMGTGKMAAPTMPTGQPREMGMEEVHVPVIDEEVVIEKTQHTVGEAEVTSETTTSDVDLPTSIMHEEIRVERHRLDHPVHPNDYKGVSAEGGVIRMPIVEEELRVTKTPIIREELVITRLPVAERETLHETVMHTEPHVETSGDVHVEGLTEEERMRKRPPAA